jgi:hypothetical protein
MLPSIKTLETLSPGNGKELRKCLEDYSYCRSHPAGAVRIAECFHPPRKYDVRLTVCDAILETCGVEYIAHKDDTFHETYGLSYCNTGDTCAPTLIFNHSTGTYRVAAWGDIVESCTGRYC